MVSREASQGSFSRFLAACAVLFNGAVFCNALSADQHAEVATTPMRESSVTQQVQDDSTVLLQGRSITVERVEENHPAVLAEKKSDASRAMSLADVASGGPAEELSPEEVQRLTKALSAVAEALNGALKSLAEGFSSGKPSLYKSNTKSPDDRVNHHFDKHKKEDHTGKSTAGHGSHGHALLSLGVDLLSTHQMGTTSRIASLWFILTLVGCTFVALLLIIMPSLQDKERRDQSQAAPLIMSPLNQSQTAPSSSMRPESGLPPPGSDMVGPTASPTPRSPLRFAGSPGHHTVKTITSPSRVQFQEISLSPEGRVVKGMPGLPPQLCPSLVLPWCQARFGVPMKQIAQITAEGELSIVGMSGNPLLRAAVRQVNGHRVLEVLMPQPGCTPRATIGPSDTGPGRASDQGPLVIRGPNGTFYAEFDMRPNGACLVTRGAETIMVIDGQPSTSEISVKSGSGVLLASAGFSSEPFGGIDHVEIRVEPGVDTVLVLGCVLAVFLFTPPVSSSRSLVQR